jgi:hypothetical protein
LKRLAILMLIFVLAPAAFAVDTWEVYPMGPSGIEFYMTRIGNGLEGPEGQATSLTIGPVWGIHETMHLYLFTGITHPDEGDGGLDFLNIGIFRNFYGGADKTFKLDAYWELSAFGPGLGMSSSLTGLEANLDFEKLGFYGRPAVSWFHDELGERDSAFSVSTGAWRQLCPKGQLFVELVFAEVGEDLETQSYAIGLNRLVSEQVELIFELRSSEPPEDTGRSFDITLGAVTVW